MTFVVDGVPQAPITLAGGHASFTTSALSTGSHTIAAQYGGNANFQPSTSPDLVQVVTQAATSTVLTSSVNPSGVGQAVTFTATVTSAGGTPTGQLQFLIDGGRC